MNNNRYFSNTAILVSLYVILTTLSMTWIGYLNHLQQPTPLIKHSVVLFIYILISELWQIMMKFMYHKNKQFTWNIFTIKSIISLILISIISVGSFFKIFILLLIYEIYQLLMYRNEVHYIETIFYPIATGFIKGMLFNLLLMVGTPFVLNFTEFKQVILPISLFFIVGRIEQQLYQTYHRQPTFNWSFISYYLIYFISVMSITFNHSINIWQLLVLLIITIGYFYLIKLDHLNTLQQSNILMIYVLFSILISTL